MKGKSFANGGTGLPWNEQWLVRNLFFRSDNIFVRPSNTAVTDDQMGLCGAAQGLHYLFQMDVLVQIILADPSAIQPKHIYFSVVSAQFQNLPVGEFFKFFHRSGCSLML